MQSFDPQTQQVSLKVVEETFVRETMEFVHVTVGNEKITTTPEHPFYLAQKGFVEAVKLRAGDILCTVNGEYVIVEQVQHEILESPVTVYNFRVAQNHTYFVGRVGVGVHNSYECTKPGESGENGNKTNIEGAINNGKPLNNHRIVSDTEASSLPATKQTPNSSADLLNPDGSVKQRRYYDADGKAEMDIDFNHTDDGTHEFPHIHIWDWTKKPPRQDSRR